MNLKDEDDDSKELDELNRNIQDNLKFEVSISENDFNAEENLKKDDWETIVDITYHFKQNIERVWNILKDFEFLLILTNSKHYPCIIKKGSNTWKKGNIFKGKFFSLYEFHCKVIKEKQYPELKKVERIFYLEKGELLKIKMILYKVTEDDSCVINWRSKIVPKLGENTTVFQIKSKFNAKDLFEKMENMLEKNPINLYQYESGIIPGEMDEVWEILTDNTKLVSVAPNNKCFVPLNINNYEAGEVVNVNMNLKGIEGSLDIKLDLKEKKKGWNKCIFGYSILGGRPFKVPRQTISVQLTKINKIETQLSIFTKIHDSISNVMLKHLSDKKKYVISSLKDYFENFYSPQDDINSDENNL